VHCSFHPSSGKGLFPSLADFLSIHLHSFYGWLCLVGLACCCPRHTVQPASLLQ
ncbi:Rho Guanine Nucleotide Exchange Factor 28, partial [Manis pentadactyla]